MCVYTHKKKLTIKKKKKEDEEEKERSLLEKGRENGMMKGLEGGKAKERGMLLLGEPKKR